MDSKSDWLDQLENDIIPCIGNLYAREVEHNNFLKSAREELQKKEDGWFLPWKNEIKTRLLEIIEMIQYSDMMIDHLSLRQNEYIAFLKQERSKQTINGQNI